MMDEDRDDAADDRPLTCLTGDERTDHINLIRDAIFSIIASCPSEKADRFTRNWLERAKFLEIYSGPTEGKIDDILKWPDDQQDDK